MRQLLGLLIVGVLVLSALVMLWRARRTRRPDHLHGEEVKQYLTPPQEPSQDGGP